MRNSKNTTADRCERIEAHVAESLTSHLRTARSSLEACLKPSEERPFFGGGWQLAPYDPNLLISACEHIRLRDSFKLASYQFMEGSNGNGFTLVIPEDRELPDPGGKIEMWWEGAAPVFTIADTAAPDWMHQNVSEFLEGDKSMLSYFEVSLFLRELRELGAMWHGCDWGDHEVLVSPRACDPVDWTWHASEPADWRPSVTRATRKTVRVESSVTQGWENSGSSGMWTPTRVDTG